MTTEVKSRELTWHSSDLDEVVSRFNRAEYVSKQMKQHPEVHNWVYSCLS